MDPSGPATIRRGRRLTLGIAFLAALVLLVTVRLAPWQLLWRPNAGVSPRLRGEVLVGETEGRVKTVELSTRTIYVSSWPLGFRAMALAVHDDAQILVGDKEGGFDDIRQGMRVKVFYEVRPDIHVAKSIEVLVNQDATGRRVSTQARATNAGISSSVNPEPKDPDALLPRRPAGSPAASGAGVRAATEAGSKPPIETGRQSGPRSASELSRSPATRERPASTASASDERPKPNLPPQGRTDIRTPPRDGSQEREVSDPAAVIDWLLKEYAGGTQ